MCRGVSPQESIPFPIQQLPGRAHGTMIGSRGTLVLSEAKENHNTDNGCAGKRSPLRQYVNSEAGGAQSPGYPFGTPRGASLRLRKTEQGTEETWPSATHRLGVALCLNPGRTNINESFLVKAVSSFVS